MIFRETGLPGAFVVELERLEDERGFFARAWCREEFAAHGLSDTIVQCNLSHNRSRGTLRGMHWQESPYEEVKLVRCVRGAIHDVIVDLRPGSPAYGRWEAFRLDDERRDLLYVPERFAHGFVTLEDDTEILYGMSQVYDGPSARGFRWDDPAFAIDWPDAGELQISERDRAWPDFDLSAAAGR